MTSVRKRHPQSVPNDNQLKQSTSGLLSRQENNEGLEVKYVVFILIVVFVVTFAAALYCLGLIGHHTFPQPNLEHGEYDSTPDSQPNMSLNTEPSYQVPIESNIHVRDPIQRNTPDKSDKTTPHSDYEPPMREEIHIPPAPKGTILDKPTILWWTEALYPHFGVGDKKEIQCGQSTCLSTVHKNLLSNPMTRGIMFYGTDVRSYKMPLPRKPWHEWALFHEESPQNNYLLAHAAMLRLFNHTATFNRASHFPLTTQNIPNLDYLVERKPVALQVKNEFRRNGTLAPVVYVQSHCDVPSDRDRYVKKLMEYIDIDSYGKCVHNKEMPAEIRNPVDTMSDERFYQLISKYKFHLAFENALCDDYVTEKLFRPLYLGSVPVTRGSSKAQDWAPSKQSIIVSEEFVEPEHLADHLKFLDENDDEYLKYLEFKNTGVTNENVIKHIQQRPWGVNDVNYPEFITSFECYVCEKLVKRWEAEKAHEADPSKALPPPLMAEYSHMPCQEPHASVYPLEKTEDTKDLQDWRGDFWFNLDQAMALTHMIQEGYKSSDKVFDVIDKLRLKPNRRH